MLMATSPPPIAQLPYSDLTLAPPFATCPGCGKLLQRMRVLRDNVGSLISVASSTNRPEMILCCEKCHSSGDADLYYRMRTLNLLSDLLRPMDAAHNSIPGILPIPMSSTRTGKATWYRILIVKPSLIQYRTPDDKWPVYYSDLSHIQDKGTIMDLSMLTGRGLGLTVDDRRGWVKVGAEQSIEKMLFARGIVNRREYNMMEVI